MELSPIDFRARLSNPAMEGPSYCRVWDQSALAHQPVLNQIVANPEIACFYDLRYLLSFD